VPLPKALSVTLFVSMPVLTFKFVLAAEFTAIAVIRMFVAMAEVPVSSRFAIIAPIREGFAEADPITGIVSLKAPVVIPVAVAVMVVVVVAILREFRKIHRSRRRIHSGWMSEGEDRQ
jgi:hypothetical protein